MDIGRSLASHHGCSLDDCQHDVVVTGAAAEIALEILADLPLARIGVVFDEIERAHDHPRSAEPALQRMVVAERLLHRVQGIAGRDTLDRQHRAALCLQGEQGAGLDGFAVDMNDTGAALARVAPDMSTGEAKLLAQQLHQKRSALDGRRNRLAVYGKAHRLLHRYLPGMLASSVATTAKTGRNFMPARFAVKPLAGHSSPGEVIEYPADDRRKSGDP